MANGNGEPSIISYLTLRKFIGFLGMGLPFILLIGGWWDFGEGIQSSVSAYYHTGMRNAFVGILFALGVFLMTYKGYDWVDNIFTTLASPSWSRSFLRLRWTSPQVGEERSTSEAPWVSSLLSSTCPGSGSPRATPSRPTSASVSET